MYGILAHAFCIKLANCVGLGFARIGGADDFAPLGHGTFPFERGNDDRSTRHKLTKRGEKWPFAMHGVKSLSLAQRDVKLPHPEDREPFVEDSLDDVARYLVFDSVGFDDAKGAFDGHGRETFKSTKGVVGGVRCGACRSEFARGQLYCMISIYGRLKLWRSPNRVRLE